MKRMANIKSSVFFAKKARGYMANYLIENRIDDIDQLRKFQAFGYEFSKSDSTISKPVFTRSEVSREAA